MMLAMSAAFDSVDHATLLQRLNISYGFDGTVIHWFTSYLSGHAQRVCSAGSTNPLSTLSCGVPQGSVLGPILFLLYTADLMSIVKRHKLLPHVYADDVQILIYFYVFRMFSKCYGSCTSSEIGTLQECISVYFEEVSAWTASNRLQLDLSSKMRIPLVCFISTTKPDSGCPGANW